MDLNSLSPAALKAAMADGTKSWGSSGSADGRRYCEDLPKPHRRKCFCGCGGKITHMGANNGVGLYWGCELSVRRWVRDPKLLRLNKNFQPGDEVTVYSNGRECPGTIKCQDPNDSRFWRVMFRFGADAPVHPEAITLVRSAGSFAVPDGSNVVSLRGVP